MEKRKVKFPREGRFNGMSCMKNRRLAVSGTPFTVWFKDWGRKDGSSFWEEIYKMTKFRVGKEQNPITSVQVLTTAPKQLSVLSPLKALGKEKPLWLCPTLCWVWGKLRHTWQALLVQVKYSGEEPAWPLPPGAMTTWGKQPGSTALGFYTQHKRVGEVR